MTVKFKVEGVSKNVVRMVVVPPSNASDGDLKPSGMPSYGSCELVIPDEDDLELFKECEEITATFGETSAETE